MLLVHGTADPDSLERRAIIRKSSSCFDLAADEADEFLWKITDANRDLPASADGSLAALTFALDIGRLALRAEHGLPRQPRRARESASLREFAGRVGFPLIGKPKTWGPRRAVYFCRTGRMWKQFSFPTTSAGISCAPTRTTNISLDDQLTPLFEHAPNVSHYSCTLCPSDGRIEPISFAQCHDPAHIAHQDR